MRNIDIVVTIPALTSLLLLVLLQEGRWPDRRKDRREVGVGVGRSEGGGQE